VSGNSSQRRHHPEILTPTRNSTGCLDVIDGLVTAAHWSFAGMTVDSSRDRWVYGTPGGLGIVPVAPTVTFGGQTIYFDTNSFAGPNAGIDPPRVSNNGRFGG
jgi:hypothetical protein